MPLRGTEEPGGQSDAGGQGDEAHDDVQGQE